MYKLSLQVAANGFFCAPQYNNETQAPAHTCYVFTSPAELADHVRKWAEMCIKNVMSCNEATASGINSRVNSTCQASGSGANGIQSHAN